MFSRMKFCPKITKMKFNTLDAGLTGYEPEFFLDKDGEATGIMPAHIEVLAKSLFLFHLKNYFLSYVFSWRSGFHFQFL